jgi:hypothetical protein
MLMVQSARVPKGVVPAPRSRAGFLGIQPPIAM